MILFPAVDIQNGHAVRLKQGRKDEATIFADNPLDLARRWRDGGASWLHVIDLDGAFAGLRANAEIIGQICRDTGLSVQVGGGIRREEDARAYLEAGASRLITGTLALEDPEGFAALCRAFPGKIGVSLDAENGRLKSRGWVRDTGLGIDEVVPAIEQSGAAFIIYTDITRDGMHKGINLGALRSLLKSTSLPVIAAGGVSSLEDIARAFALRHAGNLEGVISGRAICDGSLNLGEAIEWLARAE